jgi:hypothetical protein
MSTFLHQLKNSIILTLWFLSHFYINWKIRLFWHCDFYHKALFIVYLQPTRECAENKIKMFPSLGIFKNGEFLKYEGKHFSNVKNERTNVPISFWKRDQSVLVSFPNLSCWEQIVSIWSRICSRGPNRHNLFRWGRFGNENSDILVSFLLAVGTFVERFSFIVLTLQVNILLSCFIDLKKDNLIKQYIQAILQIEIFRSYDYEKSSFNSFHIIAKHEKY